MTSNPLFLLYSEWLRQGSDFNFMSHFCKYLAYTYGLENVTFVVKNQNQWIDLDNEVHDVHIHPAKAAYQLENNAFWTYPILADDAIVGAYLFTPTATSNTDSFLDCAYQAATAWLLITNDHSQLWKFADSSQERWMVVNNEGVLWRNKSIEPWFTLQDRGHAWPSWVHPEAVVRNKMFWNQFQSKPQWSGLVTGSNDTTWWYIQALQPNLYLVRVNTYEELTANLLAQSHWQRHDPLTAIPREPQMQWHWNPDEQDWSVVLISMDNFYSWNRKYGSDNVDKCLLHIKNLLTQDLPDGWTLWRGKAEQFYLMGPHFKTDWILPLLQTELPESGLPTITTSIGVGTHALFGKAKQYAKEALEKAIEKGGRQLIFNSHARRIRCADSIKEAVASLDVSKELQFEYQPILNNNTIGFRVNPYWEHPVWNKIQSDEFLPYAEDDALQEYMYCTMQHMMSKSYEWSTLGLPNPKLMLPLPKGIWKSPALHSILLKDSDVLSVNTEKILEIDLDDLNKSFDLLKDRFAEWQHKRLQLALHIKENSEPNILKILQLQPQYVTLNWPFSTNGGTHKAMAETLAFLINRQIKVIAYCTENTSVPSLFTGIIQHNRA